MKSVCRRPTLFLDGQHKSIKAVLNLCKYFEQISGLKINETKTKAACVGHLFDSQTNSKSIFTNLDWYVKKFIFYVLIYR